MVTTNTSMVKKRKHFKKLPMNIFNFSDFSRPFSCEICGKTFKASMYLKLHLSLHQKKKLKCDKCHKMFPTLRYLKSHRRSVHGPKATCSLCFKEIKLNSMRIHMKRHNKIRDFLCDLCPSRCVQKGEIRSHMQKHRNLKLQN